MPAHRGSLYTRFETCDEYRARLIPKLPPYAYMDRANARTATGASLDFIGDAYNLQRRIVEDTVK